MSTWHELKFWIMYFHRGKSFLRRYQTTLTVNKPHWYLTVKYRKLTAVAEWCNVIFGYIDITSLICQFIIFAHNSTFMALTIGHLYLLLWRYSSLHWKKPHCHRFQSFCTMCKCRLYERTFASFEKAFQCGANGVMNSLKKKKAAFLL